MHIVSDSWNMIYTHYITQEGVGERRRTKEVTLSIITHLLYK